MLRLPKILGLAILLSLAAGEEDDEEAVAYSEAVASDESVGSDDLASTGPSSVYVMEHGVLTTEHAKWLPRGTMMLSSSGAGYEARLSDAKEFVQLKPQIQQMINDAAKEDHYYAIRMYNPASPQRTLQASIPMKLLADHFEDWHDILEVSVNDGGIPVSLSYRVKHTLGLMPFDHTQVHLSEPSRLEGARVQPPVKDADGNIKQGQDEDRVEADQAAAAVAAVAAAAEAAEAAVAGQEAVFQLQEIMGGPVPASSKYWCRPHVPDLSDSDFGDADAQQLAAASLGPLLLSRLAFRRCRLRTPAGAVAVARMLNSFGKVRHFSIQANAWRAEAHRAFAEQLAAPAAEGLLSLQAGYGAQPVLEAGACTSSRTSASGFGSPRCCCAWSGCRS
ncbi:unnamed protein product [Effrenium voratum]|nr:unnamed protein product [Effrenium voratum]